MAEVAWETAAGVDVASHTAVLEANSRLVAVAVPNAAWLRRLEAQRKVLQDAVNMPGGVPKGRVLRFVVDPNAVAEKVRSRPARRPSRRPSATASTELSAAQREALGRVDDTELREVVTGWMRRCNSGSSGRIDRSHEG